MATREEVIAFCRSFYDGDAWGTAESDRVRRAIDAVDALRARTLDGPVGTYDDGFEAARKAFAALVRDYKRDASFDDSAVGAAEHQANQENIARAIEGAALKRSQDQEAGRS